MLYFLSLISRFSENLIMTMGAHVSWSVSGVYFLAFPVSITSAAYVMVILQKHGLGFSLSVLFALLFCILLGMIFSLLYFRVSNDSFAVITLASLVALDAVIKSWDTLTGGVLGLTGVTRPAFVSSFSKLVILQVVIAIAVVFFEYIIFRSSLGRCLKAMKEDAVILKSFGRSPSRYGVFVIMSSCLLCGITGILTIWRIQYLDPTFGGIPVLVLLLSTAILAHKPKASWMVASTLLLLLLPELFRFFDFPSTTLGYMRLLFYSVFIIVLILMLGKKMNARTREV